MQTTTRTLPAQKSIALIAHDHCKADLLIWSKQHSNSLMHHTLYATGTTGHLIQQQTPLKIKSMLSGPLGGDQQIGSLISQGEIDLLIFFWDPLNAVPHDPDVKALLRLATLWNIPFATNVATANLLVNSPYLNTPMNITVPDYHAYLNERIG